MGMLSRTYQERSEPAGSQDACGVFLTNCIPFLGVKKIAAQ